MERVTGIGGVFQRAGQAASLRGWYAEHLGIDLSEWGTTTFESTSVTSQSALLSRRRRSSNASSSGTLNERWSNCGARASGTPAAFSNGSVSESVYSKNATVHCSPNSKK